MAASLENGVHAAILAIRQGGEYHFTPLAGFVAFNLGETVCVYDGTQVTKVILLDSQPGTVEHGEIIYQNGVAQACHAIADYSPSFEMIQDVMSTSVVLAEFGERFEGACTILLSKNIVKAIQDSPRGSTVAQEFGKVLKANTTLTLISRFHEQNPSAASHLLAYMVFPVVRAIYTQFTSPFLLRPSLDIRNLILPSHSNVLSRHTPAVSHMDIPEALCSFSASPEFFLAPMLAPSRILVAIITGRSESQGITRSGPTTGRSRHECDTPPAQSSTVTLGKRKRSEHEDNPATGKKTKRNNKENTINILVKLE